MTSGSFGLTVNPPETSTLGFTTASPTGQLTIPFVEVRCPTCGKLICKWEYTGIASLEIKCTRCGSINVIRLSTM